MVPIDPLDALRESAARLSAEGDRWGSLAIWEQICRSSTNPRDWCSLAVTSDRAGKSDQVEPALREAVLLDPEFLLPHVMLCRSAVRDGRWDEAEEHARRALRLEEDAEAYGLLGVILDVQDRYEEAYAAFERSIELDPNEASLYCDFGQLVRKRDLAKAELLFCKAIKLSPDSAEAHRELGSLLLRPEIASPPSERNALRREAEHHLRRAIELDPGDTWARLYLGNLLYARNDVKAALIEFRWAHESAPEWPVTMWCLADCHAVLEEWASAERLYQRALEAEPDCIAANRGIADMFLAQGRVGLARTYFDRVLLLDPNDRSAREGMEKIVEAEARIPSHMAGRIHKRQSRLQRRRDSITD